MENTLNAIPVDNPTPPGPRSETSSGQAARPSQRAGSSNTRRRYYHADAEMLVLNNRLFILSLLGIVTALAAMAMALYLGLRPPTVIRVNSQGASDVIRPDGAAAGGSFRVATTPADRAADEIERRGYINNFLQLFEILEPKTAEANMAQALNMMHESLRVIMRNQLAAKQVIATIRSKNMRSTLDLRSIEPAGPGEQYKYVVIANKSVKYFEGIKEKEAFMTINYKIDLAPVERTLANPTGLIIASFDQKILSEKTQTAE